MLGMLCAHQVYSIMPGFAELQKKEVEIIQGNGSDQCHQWRTMLICLTFTASQGHTSQALQEHTLTVCFRAPKAKLATSPGQQCRDREHAGECGATDLISSKDLSTFSAVRSMPVSSSPMSCSTSNISCQAKIAEPLLKLMHATAQVLPCPAQHSLSCQCM